MSGEQAKRTIYDSVFTDLFSDPENRVRLYRELHPEEDIRAEDIQVTTLKAVLTDHLYNDLGMQVGNRMLFLAEAQSTWCENIAFRAMVYLAETLKKITEYSGVAEPPVRTLGATCPDFGSHPIH